jgi:predicted secreted hydrolase
MRNKNVAQPLGCGVRNEKSASTEPVASLSDSEQASGFARSRLPWLTFSIGLVLLFIAALTLWGAASGKLALPGYQFEFPRDYFSHPDFATEWWYYTGNLTDPSGRPFGFELTFFRQAIDANATNFTGQSLVRAASVWRPDQVYLAHLALSDIQGRQFFHTERLSRAGPGLAGVSLDQARYWNGNWQVQWQLPGSAQRVQAVTPELTLQLELRPEKPPVIHGKNGVSQKGPEPGKASHYISFTRMAADGALYWKGLTFRLKGLAWMDHEFFTQQLDDSQAGWDWFCVQLDNREELMFYRLRKKNGAGDPFSSGTFVDARGAGHFLSGSDFTLQPGTLWTSPKTGAIYPIAWTLTVPSLGLQLSEETPLKDQELDSRHGFSPTYWEGAVRYHGTRGGQPVQGVGYLEMTGYDHDLVFGRK